MPWAIEPTGSVNRRGSRRAGWRRMPSDRMSVVDYRGVSPPLVRPDLLPCPVEAPGDASEVGGESPDERLVVELPERERRWGMELDGRAANDERSTKVPLARRVVPVRWRGTPSVDHAVGSDGRRGCGSELDGWLSDRDRAKDRVRRTDPKWRATANSDI